MSALGRFRLPNWDGRHDKNGVPLADAAQNFVYKKVLPAYHSIVEGHGGAPFPGSASPEAILHNPNIVFINSVARHDLAAGIVDRRILAVLQVLSTRWEIGIWNFKTGHGKFTSFGTVSNHWFGRATDIGTVNGRPVSDQPKVAHDIIKFLWRMGKHDPLRPDEVGSPWDPGGGAGSDGFFTNAEHQNHIHLGFEHG